MKKSFKILFSLVCLSLVFSLFSTGTFAKVKEDEEKEKIISKENAFFDESLGKYVTPLKKVDGHLVPMTKEEYINATEDQGPQETTQSPENNDSENEPDYYYYEYWRYVPFETFEREYGPNTLKATADIYCNTSAGCSISKQVSIKVAAQYSVTASAEIGAIQSGAGFQWIKEAADNSVYTFNLANGQSGYIGFRPAFKKTRGYLRKYSNMTGYLGIEKMATGYSVRTTSSGEADGYYTFVYN